MLQKTIIKKLTTFKISANIKWLEKKIGKKMERKIKSIILAAGKGTRMKSEKSKVLHTIFNKELLGYVIDAVNNTGKAEENYIIVGHQAEAVEQYVTKNYNNAKCRLQSPQLGTGHAAFQAYEDLKGFDGNVLILCGDTPLLTAETLNKFIEFHNAQKSTLTVMSAIFDDPTNYGRIVRDENGNLKAIVEEKDALDAQKKIKEINTGVYLLDWQKVSPSFLEMDSNNAQNEYYLTDIVKWTIKNGYKAQSYILENNEESFGINSKKHLAQATKILKDRVIEKHLTAGVTIVDPDTTYISPETEIDTDTIIYPCTYIEGKNKIGKNCKIGPFARIRGDVELGDFVKIGNFVEIKKSKIKNNTNVSHLSYIGDSQLGNNVNIGAGTITANYNHITKEKSQTIIEDNASTGSNSVLVAPTRIGENASIGAGSVISKDVEPNALALTHAPMKLLKDWFFRHKK